MLTLLLSLAHADTALFLGNSFTFSNELDQTTLALLVEGQPGWADGSAARLADPGLTFEDHVSYIQTAGSNWELALGEAGPDWTWVVLQEQSQIPGFPATEAMLQGSLAAAAELNGYASAHQAGTVFLMTWGYLTGDETNPEIFPDYPTMQAALTGGYEAYRDATRTDSRPTWLAPAGLAWSAAYDEAVAAGEDPLSPDSHFAQLYAVDGHHPSPLGTYLAAAVIYATLTGDSPVGLSPSAALDAEDALWAQETAAATVFDESRGYSYPWTAVASGDSGDSGDSGEEADSDSTPIQINPVKSEESCGCAGGGASGWMGAVIAAGAALRGRRRSGPTNLRPSAPTGIAE